MSIGIIKNSNLEQMNGINKLVKSDILLGSRKTIIGDPQSDLVFQTLSNIYIKVGSNLKLLQEVVGEMGKHEDSDPPIIFVSSEADLKELLNYDLYPGDGVFVYNTLSKVLYITVNNDLVAIADTLSYNDKEGYVKKSGDVMTGQLEINTKGPALIINSNSLIKNLNSEYLNGYPSNYFTNKYNDETIYGSWTYNGKGIVNGVWNINNNMFFNKDAVFNACLGSKVFSSGFGGSGWRLDGSTGMLTIDYLVVRKAMRVYEMVINKISATNGSLWISNASKCNESWQPVIIDNLREFLTNGSDMLFPEKLKKGYYIFRELLENGELVNNIKVAKDETNTCSNYDYGEYVIYTDFTYLVQITKELELIEYINTLINGIKNGNEGYTTPPITIDELLYRLLDKDLLKLYFSKYLQIIDVIYDYDKQGNTSVRKENPALDKNSSMFVYLKLYNEICQMYLYYKYFGLREDWPNNYWIIHTDPKEYALFKEGDILRCQKLIETGEIKYYDAIVLKQIGGRYYLIQKASSVFDVYTEVSYDEDGNADISTTTVLLNLYDKGSTNSLSQDDLEKLGDISKDDNLVLIGNILDPNRQGAVYITASDDNAPFIEVISYANRPDYSIIYELPEFVLYENYYVSKVQNDKLLGVFKIHTKDGSITITDSTDPGGDDYSVEILYGYETPNLNCLVYKTNGIIKSKYNKTTKARLGKLDGLFDSILGNNQPHGYGLYSDNVFLTGEFYLNNGKSIASFADDIALLSGEILHIDIDQLKLEVTASVENIIEDKFKSMTEDEEGNEIPAGFAGLFTFDYTDITGDGALDGKKGLAVLGDSIVFYTSENGKFDFNDPTALIRNKKINADLIDVKELEFDKLVGKSTIDSYEHVITVTYSYDLNTYENVKITGLVGLDYSRPAIGTLSNTLYGGILTLRDFNTEKGHNIKLKEINVDGVFTYDYEVSNRILANVSEVPLGDYISELDANGGEDVSISEIKKNTIEEYTITTINGKSKGESVIYYPDGSVLNAKIISTDTSGKVTGCVEYFFAQGKIRIDTLLDKGDEYIVQNFMEGEVLQELYKGGLLKRINYFDFADSFVINWVLYYDRYDTKDEWIALFEDLYMNTGILLNELEEMYDHMVKLDTAAKNGNGKYQSDYSNFVAAVLSSLHGTQGSGKIGKGSGYGSIQSGNKIFFPSGKWYSYDSLLEQKINDSIRNNGNYYDDIKNKNIIEGLYITHYELKDPGTTEGEHNSGNFNILYFNSEKSIEGKITFTIENGNYNGGAGMSPIK